MYKSLLTGLAFVINFYIGFVTPNLFKALGLSLAVALVLILGGMALDEVRG